MPEHFAETVGCEQWEQLFAAFCCIVRGIGISLTNFATRVATDLIAASFDEPSIEEHLFLIWEEVGLVEQALANANIFEELWQKGGMGQEMVACSMRHLSRSLHRNRF
jgi:hypothetical protein